MLLIIDNTKDLDMAKMTPKIIDILDKMNVKYIIVSTKKEIINLISKNIKLSGIILSGGPLHLSNKKDIDKISKNVLAINYFKNTPILGICFGFHILCYLYGSTIFSYNK